MTGPIPGTGPMDAICVCPTSDEEEKKKQLREK